MDGHIERLHKVFRFDHRFRILRIVDVGCVLRSQLQTLVAVGVLHEERRQMNMVDVTKGRQQLYSMRLYAHQKAGAQGC